VRVSVVLEPDIETADTIMKRFDFAADVSKQLITICAAIITVLITFYDKFLSHGAITFVAVVITLILFIVSIACGIFALGGLVNLVERQERAAPPPPPPPFVALAGSSAQFYAQLQQLTFALALVLFVAVAFVDHYFPAPAQPAHRAAVQ